MFAMLGLTLTSCTKETVTDDAYMATVDSSVIYFINGQVHYANPQTDEEWSAFFDHMLALTQEGYQVRIRRTSSPQQTLTAKEKVTFTTADYNEAKEWAKQKTLEGYIVTIDYNQQTGKYTCIAIR